MINGIDYLKRMYPDCDDEDYQPSGLDLRLGKVYELSDDTDGDVSFGLFKDKKILPKLYSCSMDDFFLEYNVKGWSLLPNRPYICEVDRQIKIGSENAQFYLPRSSLLRAGVNVYTALGDLGYNGHLSFLVINHSTRPFFLEKGVRFAQLVDFRVRGGSESYDGDYQEKEVIADWDMNNRIQF